MDTTATAIVNPSTDKVFPCTYCDKVFSRRKNLNLHLCIHTGERKQICTICNKQFIQSCHLKRHYRSHAGEKPFGCEICGKHFSQNGHLKVHIQSHLGNKNYICEYCQKSFVQNSQLKRHLRSHLNERPYVCSYCNKSYKFSDHLHAHVRTHTGELPYKCDDCNKKFHTSANLNAHKRVHNKYKDRKFKCILCVKKFHSKNSLAKHLSVHSQEKPFSCSLCGRRFKQQSKLKTHFEGHKKEMESKNNLCVICEKTFTSLCILKDHMLEHCTSTTYVCNICDKVFRVNSSLEMHYSQHTGHKMAYRCLEVHCEQEFNTIENIREHIKIHPSTCSKDQKSELLKVVEGRYLEEQENAGGSSHKTVQEECSKSELSVERKQYKCPVKCGQAYKTVSALCNHLQNHIGEQEDDIQEDEDEDSEDEEGDQLEADGDKPTSSYRQIQGESKFGRAVLVKPGVEERNKDKGLTQDLKKTNESIITIENIEPISLSENPMFHIGQVCSKLLTVDYGHKQDTNNKSTVNLVRTSQGSKPNDVLIESKFVEAGKTSSSVILRDPGVYTGSEKVGESREELQSVFQSSHGVTFEHVSSDKNQLNSQNAEFVILQTSSGTKKSVLVPSQGVLSCVQGLLRVGEVVIQDTAADTQIEDHESKLDMSQDRLQTFDGASIFQDESGIIDSIGIESEEVVSQESLTVEEDKLTPQNTMFQNSSKLIGDHSDYFQGHRESGGQDDLESSGYKADSYSSIPESGPAISSSSSESSSENGNTYTTSSLEGSDARPGVSPAVLPGFDENPYQKQLIEMGHDYPSNAFISPMSNNGQASELRDSSDIHVLDTGASCSKGDLPTVMFECPLCESYFNNKSELKEHLQTHLGDGKRMDNILVSIVMYLCHMCDEEFTDKETLKKHIQVQHKG